MRARGCGPGGVLLCALVRTWFPALREAEWRLAQVCRRCCDPSSAAEPTKGACEPLRSAEDAGRTPVRSGSVLCKCITKVALVQRYSSCGHQVSSRYQSLISVYCRMVSFGLNILVCISKHRKYSLLGGTLCCFYFGVNCKWVVWYWAGLHLTSYFLNWDERQLFFYLVICVLNRFFIIHFVRVCQACGSATKKFMCVLCSALKGIRGWGSI